jgi:RNA-directed DNA polymerase
MGRIVCGHSYGEVISLDNLLEAWREFLRGKRSRLDVQQFECELMENLIGLHERLADFSYQHGPYDEFRVADPKPRVIHKATVADRVLHRALYRKLYPFFDRTFIADSFSCRLGKGTHRAMDRFTDMARQVSHNHRHTAWVLQCDIRKFFASIDHRILLQLVGERITSVRLVWLVAQVVRSHHSVAPDTGLPLGNLTSQLFANVYLNELDQFVKHRLKVRHYVRYADDFAILSLDKKWLVKSVLPQVEAFLLSGLRLRLHPEKVTIKTIASGADFLGWVHFPDHRILRTVTARRMREAVAMADNQAAIDSYRGLLRHGNARKIDDELFRLSGQ